MAYEHIRVENLDGGVAVLTLARAQALNAMSGALMREMAAALATLEADPAVGAVVVAGAGEKAFSAGGDIHEMTGLDQAGQDALRDFTVEFLWQLANVKVPTVGAINGLAYGGGATLASCLD